jgi:hypothetical protein
MPIDPSIALQYKPMELPDPLERATKQQNLLTSQAQLKESEYKLQKLQSDEARLNQFYQSVAANGGPKNGLEIEDAMFKSGIPAAVDKALQLRSTRLQIESERQRISNIMGNQMPTGAPAANESLALPTTAPVANALAPAPAANAPVANALAPAPTAAPVVNALAAPNVDDLRRRRDLLLQDGSPQALELAKSIDKDIALLSKEPVYHNVPGVGLVDPRTGKVIAESKEKTPLQINYAAAVSQGFKGSIFDYERAIKMAGRTPAALPTPSAPVEVLDPKTGKSILVSRDEAIRGRMTPAKAIEGVTPKDKQKRESAYPQATAAVNGFEKKSDSFIRDLQELRDHPGLSSITGIAAGRLPGITGSGRAAQALFDKAVAKGGFQALQDLRDASKTGGALGNVSNQEGKQLTASFAAIDRRQDAPDVIKAIDQAISDIQGARTRTREAYDMTYEYKNRNAPTAGGGVDTSNPLLR